MEKQEKQPSFTSELGQFMTPYKGKYVASTLLSVASVMLSIASFAFVGLMGGYLFMSEPDIANITLYLALAIVCKILSAILVNSSTWVSHKAAYATLKDIRLAMTAKMLRLPMGYFETQGTGRLKALLVDRVESMEKTLAHMIPELIGNLLGPLGCMIFMFVIDWRLALVVIGWIMLGFSVTAGLMKGYEGKYATQIAKMKGMNQAVVEYVNGIEVIKNFGRTDDVYAKYKDAVNGYADYNIKWQKSTQGYSALGMAIAPFSLFPVLMLGIHLHSLGTLSSADLFLSMILTFAIFGPLMRAMNYFDQLAGLGTNAKEIRDVLDYREVARGTLTEAEDTAIEFNHVDFAYDKADGNAISDVSFRVNAGEMFALVGPSGSGKSTIAKLLLGYWDVDNGNISIGGHDISEYTQETLNKLIAYVDQDTFLFDKSIKDNIRLARPDATDSEVIDASRRAGCHDFIMALPNGYDTLVGEAGDKLSGGEKQRIAIVRAMMKDAPIMVLDEATASTDPENEASIQAALYAASQGKTLIVVAHRLYTIKDADKIAFVKNGRIEMIGTHAELLAHHEEYKRLWDLSEEALYD